MPYVYSVYEIERKNGVEISRTLACKGTTKELVSSGMYSDEIAVASAFASNIKKQLRGSKQTKKVWEREWVQVPGEKKPKRFYLPDKVEPDQIQEEPEVTAPEQESPPKQEAKQEVKKPKKEKDAGVVKSSATGETYMHTRTGKFIRNPDALMLDIRDMEAENERRRERGQLPLSYGYWRAMQVGRL